MHKMCFRFFFVLDILHIVIFCVRMFISVASLRVSESNDVLC